MLTPKKLIIKKVDIILFFISVVYLLAFGFDIRSGYISGDEMGFLSGFEDRGSSIDMLDWRYIIWTLYILETTDINQITPLILNFAIAIYFLRKLILQKFFSTKLVIMMLFLPTTFYFFNSYLRDPAFMIFSIALISWLAGQQKLQKKGYILFTLVWLIVVTIRPFYGVIYLVSFAVSHQFFSRYFKIILLFTGAVFITSSLAIAFDYEIFKSYLAFFENGHLRGKSQVGALMISLANFEQVMAAKNFLFSPVYFWFVPGQGFGEKYDLLLHVENLFLLVLFAIGLRTLFGNWLRSDQALRMSWMVLMFSLFMAAATPQHNDSYRYRLIFIPFLAYIASSSLRGQGSSTCKCNTQPLNSVVTRYRI